MSRVEKTPVFWGYNDEQDVPAQKLPKTKQTHDSQACSDSKSNDS